MRRRAALAALLATAATGCGADARGTDGGSLAATPADAPARRAAGPAITPAGVAHGGTAAPNAPPSSQASALRAAEALFGLDSRRLGIRVVLRGPRRGVAARLDQLSNTVTLFASGSEAPHRLAHDLAHELGHAVDLDGLAAGDRRAYLARRGRPGAAWWPAAGAASDYTTGAGDFAEVFALCHAASPVFRSRLAPRPVDACALLPPAASSYVARASKGTW